MSDKLLEVISTKGVMSIYEFNRAFDIIYSSRISNLENPRYIRNQIVNFLECMGHCEFDFSSRKILKQKNHSYTDYNGASSQFQFSSSENYH